VAESVEQTCIFCRIGRGELPATIVHDDADVVGFRDLNPQAPEHTLVIPRKHVGSVDELDEGDADLIARLILAARDIARRQGIAEPGYRLVTNVGVDGGQSVAHLHLHLLGGRPFRWPPG
jgi:histidine triad (HIT) family protein